MHVVTTDMSSPVVNDCCASVSQDSVASVVKSCERLSLTESDNCSTCTSNADSRSVDTAYSCRLPLYFIVVYLMRNLSGFIVLRRMHSLVAMSLR